MLSWGPEYLFCTNNTKSPKNQEEQFENEEGSTADTILETSLFEDGETVNGELAIADMPDYSVVAAKPVAKISPVKASLNTTAAWFGFGVVLDRVVTFAGKFLKTKPLTTSIIANGVIAAGAGAYTYITAKSKK